MAVIGISALKAFFETGDIPTESNYVDLIDTLSVGDFIVYASDLTSDLSTGTTKGAFHAPYAFTITDIKANVISAPTGASIVVDVKKNGVTILSTVITIDAGETSSRTAATPPVISVSALAEDDVITIDINQVGSTLAGSGLSVTIIGNRT